MRIAWRDQAGGLRVPFGTPLPDLRLIQAFPAQDSGLLTVRRRLVLGDHPMPVLGREGPPNRLGRRVRQLLRVHRMLQTATHWLVSRHALQRCTPGLTDVSLKPGR